VDIDHVVHLIDPSERVDAIVNLLLVHPEEEMLVFARTRAEVAELAAELAEQMGSASAVILASHGVIVTGPTIREATYRAASIDRVCRLAYDLMVLGKEPLPIAAGLRVGMKKSLLERGSDVFFDGAVRQLLRTDPDVLS
jgi:ribulose-5-phosphate 4-epimerase/fuculose-1-phosphate aldolase